MALTRAAGERWQQVTGSTVVEAYGLTETSPAVAINPPLDVHPGTIGKPLPHTEVAILGPRSERLGEGCPGDLCIKGPQVMAGYWHNEQATRATFTDSYNFV